LWHSNPIPIDPMCVHGTLPDGFKARLITALQTLDLSDLPADDKKIIGFNGTRLVPQNDAAFDLIRDLVKVLHIDLKKLNT
jgi:phosphonate transport system substrate-binding protein